MTTDDERRAAMRLAHQHLAENDATGWFEALYAQTDTSGTGVPWANMRANPYLLAWFDDNTTIVGVQSALVVGCGLGDDAEALADHGHAVTAFDVSLSAIELCNQRFPESHVNYQAADLFTPPVEWVQAYDFVYESFTIQALPPHLQDDAMRQIAAFVAPGG